MQSSTSFKGFKAEWCVLPVVLFFYGWILWLIRGRDRRAYSCLGLQWKWRVKLSANWLYSSLSATLNRTPREEHKGLSWSWPCLPPPPPLSLPLHFHASTLISPLWLPWLSSLFSFLLLSFSSVPFSLLCPRHRPEAILGNALTQTPSATMNDFTEKLVSVTNRHGWEHKPLLKES